MKFSYRILPDRQLTILQFRGSISVKKLGDAAAELRADRRYNPAYNGIACLQGVTTRVRIEDLRELGTLLEPREVSVGHWAAIFTDPKTTTLALIFKAAFADTRRLEIVSSWEAACRVLQLEPHGELAKP